MCSLSQDLEKSESYDSPEPSPLTKRAFGEVAQPLRIWLASVKKYKKNKKKKPEHLSWPPPRFAWTVIQMVSRVRSRFAKPPSAAVSRACTLMPVAPEAMVVTATCSKDVELPCTPRWDPPVPYTVSWAKITEVGEERIEVLQEDLHNYQHKQKNSTSLRLQNITSCNSGTYRCTLVELAGQRNQSGMVTLKVTEVCKTSKYISRLF
ncbi:CD83 antigen isoform X2 [Erinaceus europaeus]|uniref:CD83 antigen isoform X2 n=1 Tax=Erinaceus europaeus TaxID=9365 RepID=A0ABM3X925_ERIEU|nr:CD83 antigen isoform X2 [Erinaceus europaeus]